MKAFDKVFESGLTRKYQSGQILLYQGEKTPYVFFIRSGYVKVYNIDAKGEEKVLLLLGQGDIFPLIWSFKGSRSLSYFYEVAEDAEITTVEREKFLRVVQEDHATTLASLEYFIENSSELLMRVESIEGTDAIHKVGQVIQYLAKTHGKKVAKDTMKIKPKITHQTLAFMSGLARETVSIQMKHFQDAKAITKSGSHLLVHTDRVQDLLDSES